MLLADTILSSFCHTLGAPCLITYLLSHSKRDFQLPKYRGEKEYREAHLFVIRGRSLLINLIYIYFCANQNATDEGYSEDLINANKLISKERPLKAVTCFHIKKITIEAALTTLDKYLLFRINRAKF
jgi:hypothetical protein